MIVCVVLQVAIPAYTRLEIGGGGNSEYKTIFRPVIGDMNISENFYFYVSCKRRLVTSYYYPRTFYHYDGVAYNFARIVSKTNAHRGDIKQPFVNILKACTYYYYNFKHTTISVYKVIVFICDKSVRGFSPENWIFALTVPFRLYLAPLDLIGLFFYVGYIQITCRAYQHFFHMKPLYSKNS